MQYETILVEKDKDAIRIIFNRLDRRNSINAVFLNEIDKVLSQTENDANCKIIILEGQKGIFCTGMDFEEAASVEKKDGTPVNQGGIPYMNLLKRIASIPKVVISCVDGQVMAGGVGIVVASDLVIATSRSRFSLSEALWGLLPACVMPFLIRRVGFQSAYRMTLTTLQTTAQEAHVIGLIDELSDTPEENIQRLSSLYLTLAAIQKKCKRIILQNRCQTRPENGRNI